MAGTESSEAGRELMRVLQDLAGLLDTPDPDQERVRKLAVKARGLADKHVPDPEKKKQMVARLKRVEKHEGTKLERLNEVAQVECLLTDTAMPTQA